MCIYLFIIIYIYIYCECAHLSTCSCQIGIRPYIPKRLKDVRLRIAWFVGAVWVGNFPGAAATGLHIASPGIQKGHVAVQLGGGWTGNSGLESFTNSDW